MDTTATHNQNLSHNIGPGLAVLANPGPIIILETASRLNIESAGVTVKDTGVKGLTPRP